MQKSPVTCENRWRGFVVSVAVGGKGPVPGGPRGRVRSEVPPGPPAGPAAGSPTTARSPGREHMELLHSGKVRDVYADGDDLVLVASDRVSVYDVVLPTPVPDKGKILSQLSPWWFVQLADVVPNHIISDTDVPKERSRRADRC